MSFSVVEIKKQFPALKQKFSGQDFVYLDTTNTSLKPQVVIDRIQQFYSYESSNVHRGGYQWSSRTTQNFENSRQRVAQFIGAKLAEEIIFVRGATEGINLVAYCLGKKFLSAGDEIIISEMEHHANIVPWHILQENLKIQVRAAKINDRGELDLDHLKSLLSAKTKVVALTACSNTTGTITPFKKITQMVRDNSKAFILADGAQIVTEMPVNVQDWDVDFFVFSAHKIFGPTGIGVLYGKKHILDQFPPYQGGGSMISRVTLTNTTFNEVPLRFEAGTPHIEGVVALPTALNFIEGLGWENLRLHKKALLNEATQMLKNLGDVDIYGEAQEKSAILSFNLKGLHHSDVAQILDEQGIAVRAGHHCTQPLMDRFKISGCVRASFSIYNDTTDIEKLKKGLIKARELLS
jgi:cysteine desulfurase/selenocysteine lyase